VKAVKAVKARAGSVYIQVYHANDNDKIELFRSHYNIITPNIATNFVNITNKQIIKSD
jgi:hypothetical protein